MRTRVVSPTAATLANLTGLTKRTIQRVLGQLKAHGLIERFYSGGRGKPAVCYLDGKAEHELFARPKVRR